MTVFSDVLEKADSLLTVGQNIVLSVEATNEGDQLKLLARGIVPVDNAIAGVAAKGLKVFLNHPEAVPSMARILENDIKGTRGPINLLLSHPDLPGDVEITLPGKYPVNPQMKSALKSVDGVLEVEEF